MMRTIVLFSFGLAAFGGSIKLLLLAFADYPRTPSFARWEDVVSLTVSIAWCVWLGATLWGGT